MSWPILVHNNNFIIFNIWLIEKKCTLKFISYQYKFKKKLFPLSNWKKSYHLLMSWTDKIIEMVALAHDCGSLITTTASYTKHFFFFNYLNIVIREICKTTYSTFWSTNVSHPLFCDGSMEGPWSDHCTPNTLIINLEQI